MATKECRSGNRVSRYEPEWPNAESQDRGRAERDVLLSLRGRSAKTGRRGRGTHRADGGLSAEGAGAGGGRPPDNDALRFGHGGKTETRRDSAG